MTDDLGQPEPFEEPVASEERTAPDGASEQTLSLNTRQVGQQLNIDSRTVRRYITDGILSAGGGILKLKARQVRSARGLEWQVYQDDLDSFKEERDRLTTEGQTSEQLTRSGTTAVEESQALSTSLQIFANELERRSVALTEAHQTIERLSYEAGRQAGRNEELERELLTLRLKVAEMEAQAQQWQQRPLTSRRIRFLPWRRDQPEGQ